MSNIEWNKTIKTCAAALALLVGCSKPAVIDEAAISQRCKELRELCDPGCTDRDFRSCYIDTELFPSGPYDLFKHCHAVHVGKVCAPCSQIFSLNFGGAMRDVGCEEFHRALARKGAQCSGCLVHYGDGPNELLGQ